jgi:Ser/Thr protein kinase RdoA (MazF antagonist)
LLREGLNHVLAGTRRSGIAMIIRLTDDVHRSAPLIRAELEWLCFLRRHGCTVTNPLPANDGELLKTPSVGGRTLHAVCFERLSGCPVPPGDPQQWTPELSGTMGKTLGRIHHVTAAFRPSPGVRRYPWYEETEFRHLAEYRGPLPNPVIDRIQSQIAGLRDLSPRPGQ